MKKNATRRSESVDDYLKAIFSLEGPEEKRVASKQIAERLGVAPASVTNMLQRLAGLPKPPIRYERHKGVQLSTLGRKRALEIVRHHRLLETFLFKVLGYPLTELHEEAELLEHFISESFEARVDEKLGYPHQDPHGHCIPSFKGIMPPEHGVSCKCYR